MRKEWSGEDKHPCSVERRYSEFLHLYTQLRQQYPAIFTPLDFPRKAIIGNFSPEVISFRKAGFESLLLRVSKYEEVRNSLSVIDFFQAKDRNEILEKVSLDYWLEVNNLNLTC